MDIIELTKLIGKLKKIKREGWIREGIKNSESVADHSFRVVFLSMILGSKLNINQEKLIKMAIISDLAEAKTGDVVVEWGEIIYVNKKIKKEAKEKGIIEDLFKDVPNCIEYIKIFQEMIDQKTEESRIFKQIDKLEMAFQALEYEDDNEKNLSEFFINARKIIDNPFLKEILENIIKQRRFN